MASRTVAGANWAGTYVYRAQTVHRPTTVTAVRELVTSGSRMRAIGSRHSFTAIPDSAELISLEALATEVRIDRETMTVSVPGGITYAELAGLLAREDLALANLASLPHISVAGAVSTATHGSGDRKGNLATAVSAVEIVTANGELRRVARGEPEFDGLVVGLGSLGIVTALTLVLEPHYEVSQTVYEGLGWDEVTEHFDELTGAGESVSIFHLAGARTEQVWVKRRAEDDPGEHTELFGAPAAREPLHPVIGGDPAFCTAQLGVPGPWSERLPHFRSGFQPSAGEEIQSELLVPREHAAAAIEAMRGLASRIAPLLLVGELRTVAADELWLSPQYQRPSLGLHFTWRRRPGEVQPVIAALEAALAPLGARPHWGKVFAARAAEIGPLYPRMADFLALRERLDPHRVFVNDWLIERVLGSA